MIPKCINETLFQTKAFFLNFLFPHQEIDVISIEYLVPLTSYDYDVRILVLPISIGKIGHGVSGISILSFRLTSPFNLS